MLKSPMRITQWVILFATILRLIWAYVLEASNDEAYHYLYTIHPDWSYFDHPPMTAWIAHIGIWLCGGWVHPLSLRLGFVLLFAASNWILFLWTRRWFGDRAGLGAVIALSLSAYFTAAGGVFALPDGPFFFFAVLTMWQLSEALVANKQWAWLGVGVGFAGAMLSKYHGVFLPMGAILYLLATPGTRNQFLKPGPYVAVVMGCIGFLPVVYWNSQNEWASFRFQGGRAVGMSLKPEGLLAWLGGPIAYLLPWIWYAMIRELLPRLRHFSQVSGIERLLVLLSVGPLVFFFWVSATRWVLLHWNLIGFVPMYLLVGKTWAAIAESRPTYARSRLMMMILALFGILAFAIAQARFGIIPFPGKDPTADISGWESVAAELEQRHLLDDPDQFLITNRWYDSGQLAFAIRNKRPVVCYNSLDARGFYFWSKPEDWVGKTGLLVMVDEPGEAKVKLEFSEFFTNLELIAEFPMTRGGNGFRTVRVYRGEKQIVRYPFRITAEDK